MRIALAQMNPTMGNFDQNTQKIIEFTRRAREKRADLVVFSELTLFGYPPNDLLERQGAVKREFQKIKEIASKIPKDISIVFGAVISSNKKGAGKPYQNVAVYVRKGQKVQFFAKQLLPSYDVFDETRFFEPGERTGTVNIPRVGKVAITVCEDMWGGLKEGAQKIYNRDIFKGLKGIDLIVNISASPFSQNKMRARLQEARAHVKKIKAPFVYVNQVGGQDELIFDGRSFILDEKGKIVVQAACGSEDLVMTDLNVRLSEYRPSEDDRIEVLRKILVLGIRDYVSKTGQKSVHLGLSGGIDSAVVAALAVDALGPSHVTGLLLPGPYSSKGSVTDSLRLAANLKIKTQTIDIGELYEGAKRSLNLIGAQSVSVSEQNLQARLRGLLLMGFSNIQGSMLLATSNKSELATGYSTLYGDTNGGLMPIGDLLKRDVYELGEHYNSSREIIPEEILMKAPSAELAPGQVDQDSLPPYPELDKAIESVVEMKRTARNKTEKWLVKKLAQSEFKRWQAPPILRVSDHGFGRGRRFPIAFPGALLDFSN